MIVHFDGSGAPQQGQPGVAPQPMPLPPISPGRGQPGAASPGMPMGPSGMPPVPSQHDAMLNSSSHNRHQQNMNGPPPSGSSSGGRGGMSWQRDNDAPHRIGRPIIKSSHEIQSMKQRLLLLYHSAQCPNEDVRCKVTPHCADMRRLWRHMEACKDNNCRVPHCFSSRAVLSHYHRCKYTKCVVCPFVAATVRRSKSRDLASTLSGPMMNQVQGMPANSSGGRGGSWQSNNDTLHRRGSIITARHQSSASGFWSRGPMNPSIGSTAGQQQQQQQQQQPPANMRDDREQKMRIRHKQQRLLLLHHAAKCPNEDGCCTVTQHCADMKRLWRHLGFCKDNSCGVRHCLSSRFILSHHRRCRDAKCSVCYPVRVTARAKSRHPASASSSPLMNQMQGTPTPAAQAPQPMMQQPEPLGPSASVQSASSSVDGSSLTDVKDGVKPLAMRPSEMATDGD